MECWSSGVMVKAPEGWRPFDRLRAGGSPKRFGNLARRLDGVSPYHSHRSLGRATLCGASLLPLSEL
jgi:hypothetical protein